MADEDQAIKIVVEVVDKFSKPLRDLQNQLSDMGKGGDKIGRATTQFEALRKSVSATAESIKGLLVPSLNAIGISVLGVGAAFGAMTLGLRNFAQGTKEMIFLSRETGITLDKLREFKAIGEAVGVAPERMASSLNEFARNMQELRAGVGDTLTTLRREGDAGVRAWAESLRGISSNAEMLKRYIEFVDKMPRVQDRERAYAAAGLPRELARSTAKEKQAVIDAMKKYSDDLTTEGLKATKEFNDALRDLGTTWEGVWAKLTNAGALQPFTDALRGWTAALISPEFQLGLKSLAEQLGEVSRNLLIIVPNMVTFARSISEMVGPIEKLVPLADVFNRLNKFFSGGWRQGGGQPGATFSERFGEWGGVQKESFKQSIREGVAEGFVDAALRLRKSVGGGARVIQAAYHTGGGYGGGGSYGGGDTAGDGGPTTLPSAGDGGPTSLPSGPQYSEFLAGRRARFAEEYRADPSLKLATAAILSLENEGAGSAVAESLMNRSDYTGQSLRYMLLGKGGRNFYGPWGSIPGRMAELRNQPARLKRLFGFIDEALAGRHRIGGFTDQGSLGDPNYWYRQGGYVDINRERFNVWGGGPGGHAGAFEYRQRIEAGLAAETRKKLDQAQSPAAKIEGNASLDINLNGFPKGTTTAFRTYGQLFGDVNLNRGNAAPEIAK
jgi:hypothetical protein